MTTQSGARPKRNPETIYQETGRHLALFAGYVETQAKATADSIVENGGRTTHDLFMFAMHGYQRNWAEAVGYKPKVIEHYEALETRFKGRATFPIARMWKHPQSDAQDWLVTGVGLFNQAWLGKDQLPFKYEIKRSQTHAGHYIGNILLPVVEWLDLSGVMEPDDEIVSNGSGEIMLAAANTRSAVLHEPHQQLVMGWADIFKHRQFGTGHGMDYDFLHAMRSQMAKDHFNAHRAEGAYQAVPASQTRVA